MKTIPYISLNRDLVKIIRATPVIELHNLLMSVADREIAVVIMYMDDSDRNYVLKILSGNKTDRVLDELDFLKRHNLKNDMYRVTVNKLLNSIKNKKNTDSLKSYIKPNRMK